MRIREANADDLGLLLHWTARRHDGSIYRHVPFCPHRTAGLLAHLAESEGGLLVVAEHHGERVGGLGAEVVESRFMDGQVALLWSLYADEGRSGAVGVPLLRRYVEWATERGADLIEANNSASMDDPAFMRIAERLGFRRSGSHAHLEV